MSVEPACGVQWPLSYAQQSGVVPLRFNLPVGDEGMSLWEIEDLETPTMWWIDTQQFSPGRFRFLPYPGPNPIWFVLRNWLNTGSERWVVGWLWKTGPSTLKLAPISIG